MTEKRYRTEQIVGASLPFIVDNYSSKKHNKTMIGYKVYETTTVEKCDELTDLLNNYEDENEQLKKVQKLAKENERLKQSHQSAIELIRDGIVEMLDGKRDYAEKLLNEAIELMCENKRFTLKNWNNYAEGDCIYYDNGEEMGSLDVLDTLNSLSEENEELKRVLGSILFEVKMEINNTCQSGEVRAFINPKSYDLISDVLGKYNQRVN